MSARTRLLARFLIASGLARRSLRQIRDGATPTVTILAYHRVASRDGRSSNTGDPRVISATPQEFAWQMDYLKINFTVMALEELVECAQKSRPLPPNTVVITFDDGYRDNLMTAAPILRRRALPAILFITTGMIGTRAQFWWDELHTLLQKTPAMIINLPVIGRLKLETAQERAQAMERLRQLLKRMPEEQRRAQIAALRGALGAGVQTAHSNNANPEALHLNWDEARQLPALGVTLGAHSHTHPILPRLTTAQAEAEIATSKRILETELRQPARFFAYPNGGVDDFNEQIKQLLTQYGFKAAVTLIHGVNWLNSELDWLALRRIYIGGGDDRYTFIVKISGVLDKLVHKKTDQAETIY